jgi:hypothetical protein
VRRLTGGLDQFALFPPFLGAIYFHRADERALSPPFIFMVLVIVQLLKPQAKFY